MPKAKILIVDDEPINIDFFDVMLSRLGFTVVSAEDGEEALDVIREESPDLIILDNIMPRLTGWEVTKKLKKDDEWSDFRDVPIIMFSAMDAVKDKIEGYSLGVEDYITKPFNFSEVLARIQAVLRHRELSSQVVHREKRLSLIESLNKSLIYFTDHVKQPVVDLLNAAEVIDTNDPEKIKVFVSQVKTECEETLATLAGLKDEISELRNEDDKLKEVELTISDLNEKFQKHFQQLKHNSEKLGEVSK